MKLRERYFDDDGKLIVEQTHDPNPVLDSVGRLKSAGIEGYSENKHAARIPTWLIEHWITEAGISFDDQAAVKELMHKKILSGEINALRPWSGTYNWQ